jgi:hypothetical protein
MSLKTKLLVASGAVAAGMTATPAAAEGMYFGGFVGAASVEDVDVGFGDIQPDTSVIFGAVMGGHVTENIRVEGEASYLAINGADCEGKCAGTTFDVDTLALLGNVWFDFGDSASSFRPYVGAGVGIAAVSAESAIGDDEESGLAYQVGGGVRLGHGFDVGYRYRAVTVEFEDLVGDDVDANMHIVQVAWTVDF